VNADPEQLLDLGWEVIETVKVERTGDEAPSESRVGDNDATRAKAVNLLNDIGKGLIAYDQQSLLPGSRLFDVDAPRFAEPAGLRKGHLLSAPELSHMPRCFDICRSLKAGCEHHSVNATCIQRRFRRNDTEAERLHNQRAICGAISHDRSFPGYQFDPWIVPHRRQLCDARLGAERDGDAVGNVDLSPLALACAVVSAKLGE